MILNLFKKVKFNSQIVSFLKEELHSIDWLSNIGKLENTSLNDLNIINLQNQKLSLKIISYQRNYNNYVGLDNLLLEAMNRSSAYLSIHRKNEFNWKWNKLAKKINAELDFNKLKEIEEDFNKAYKCKANLHLNYIVRGYIRDLYFKENDNQYPCFFTDVFDIYRKGNIIIGWENKFESSGKLKTKSISQKEGNLLIL